MAISSAEDDLTSSFFFFWAPLLDDGGIGPAGDKVPMAAYKQPTGVCYARPAIDVRTRKRAVYTAGPKNCCRRAGPRRPKCRYKAALLDPIYSGALRRITMRYNSRNSFFLTPPLAVIQKKATSNKLLYNL